MSTFRFRFFVQALALLIAAIAVGALAKFQWGSLLSVKAVKAQSSQVQASSTKSMTLNFKEVGGSGEVIGSGNPRLLRRGTIAVTEDGSWVEKSTIYGKEGQVVSSFREIELSDGTRIRVDDITKVVVAVRHPSFAGSYLQRASNWGSGCEERAGSQGETLPPYRSEKAGMVMTSWREKSANCEDIKRVIQFKNHAGKITDWNERSTELLTLGSPEQSLFAVPDSYERVSFVEKYNREVMRFGVPPNAKEVAALSQIDEKTKEIRYLGSIR